MWDDIYIMDEEILRLEMAFSKMEWQFSLLLSTIKYLNLVLTQVLSVLSSLLPKVVIFIADIYYMFSGELQMFLY